MAFALLGPPVNDAFRREVLHGPRTTARPTVWDDLAGALSVSGFNHVGLGIDDIAAAAFELKRRGARILLEPFDNADL